MSLRTIKRYSNRKLYDTEEKQYITLDGIAELIRSGLDVVVIENDTGEDLTAITLSQIIFEQQKRESDEDSGFFTHLIRFGTSSPLNLLRRSLYLPGSAFNVVEKEIERRLQELVERGEMAEEQMRRLRDDLMSRFNEGGRRAKGHRQAEALDELDIPTRGDVEELSARLESLTERLDELIALGHHQEGLSSESEEAAPAPRRRRRKRSDD